VGGYPCIVPRVIGLRLLIARRKIRRAHCTLGRVRYKRSRRSRAGRVIWQSPKPGAVKSMSWRVTLLIGRR
jgi:beta-lactam-binding protein with PASTA domain